MAFSSHKALNACAFQKSLSTHLYSMKAPEYESLQYMFTW